MRAFTIQVEIEFGQNRAKTVGVCHGSMRPIVVCYAKLVVKDGLALRNITFKEPIVVPALKLTDRRSGGTRTSIDRASG